MRMVNIDHTEYPRQLRAKSVAELRFIIKDAKEAMRSTPDSPNAGYWADEVSYAAMELKRREA